MDEKRKVKSKALYNKATKVLESMRLIMKCNGIQNLQFEAQELETQRRLFRSIDELKGFIDNIN